jgi:hypothetical protein
LENLTAMTLESVIIRKMMIRGLRDDHRPLGKTKCVELYGRSYDTRARRKSPFVLCGTRQSLFIWLCFPSFLLAYIAYTFYPEDPKNRAFRNFTRIHELTYHMIVHFRSQCNWRSIYLRFFPHFIWMEDKNTSVI